MTSSLVSSVQRIVESLDEDLPLRQAHTREMGIRIALGAQSGSLLGLVLREAVVLTATGAVCGVVSSLLLMRLLAASFLRSDRVL